MADNIIYETNRNSKTARKTQNLCNKSTAKRSRYSPDGSNGRGITKFRRSMAGCVQKGRTKSPGKQTASVKAVQTIQQATRQAARAPLESPNNIRLQNQLVDTAKDSTADKKTFWPVLSAFRSLVCSLADGMELSETGKQGIRTQRTGHRHLAKERLATYKKKPAGRVGPSYSLMKVVLCCNRL